MRNLRYLTFPILFLVFALNVKAQTYTPEDIANSVLTEDGTPPSVEEAFYNTGLKSVVIPVGTDSIFSNAFYSPSLTTVTLPWDRGAIYDLQGRRRTNADCYGIYIVNGKRVIRQ